MLLLAAALQFPAVTPHLAQRLDAGEIVVEMRTGADGMPEGSSTGLVGAPLERVWDLMTDFNRYPDFYNGILKSQVRRREGRRSMVLQDYWFPWPLPVRSAVLDFEVYPDRHEFEWRRIGGSVKRYEGSARFLPWPTNRTVLQFTGVFDPGFPLLPRWLLGYFTATSLPGVVSGPRDYFARTSRAGL